MKQGTEVKILKTVVRQMCAVLLMLIVGFGTNCTESQAAEIVHSGVSGDLNWSIDSEGLLMIEGTGDYELVYNKETYLKDTSWSEYAEEIKKAVVKVDGIKSTEGLFQGCNSLVEVDLSGLDTSQVTDMEYLLYCCSSLKSIVMPPNLEIEVVLPAVEEVVWKDSNGEICTFAHKDLAVPMTYTAITDPKTEDDDAQRDEDAENPTKPDENEVPKDTTDVTDTTDNTNTVDSTNSTEPTKPEDTQNKNEVVTPSAVGTTVTVSSGNYRVIKSSSTEKEVIYTEAIDKEKSSITIPATVEINGCTYKVTEIAEKAFKNNKKIKSITIGKNVSKIGKEAFGNCKKLKKLTIKSSALKSIGKNAIKNINKKATIKVPKKQLDKYKKLFKSKTGYKKSMKIKK